jgi:hypothetical protein
MYRIKSVEKIKTRILCFHILFIIVFFLNHVAYEIMSKNLAEPDKRQTI